MLRFELPHLSPIYLSPRLFCDRDHAFDIICESIHKFGCWEPDQTEIFIELLTALDQTSTVFIDVGAHVGYYSTIAARHGFNCVSLEGNPDTFQRLKESVSLNGLGTKVLPINAFCSKDGGSPRTIELGQLGITTKVLIKADVEGFESRVLAPIIKWFRDHKVIALIAEASSKYSATWPEFVSLSNQIIDLGYACYDIGNSPSRQISAEHDWLSFSILQSKRVQTIHENIQWSHDLASVGQTNLLFISKLNNLFR